MFEFSTTSTLKKSFVIACLFTLSACGGSGGGSGSTADNDDPTVAGTPVDTDTLVVADPTVAEPLVDSAPVDADPVDVDPADPADTDPVVVADPMVRNSTRVDFDIAVPAYVSNALQVRMVWDDKDIAASWVGDEFWSATDDFPTDTESLLVVTFYDDNGAVTLGSFEQSFRTGTNASESYRIAAEQFDTERWDRDGDGESNLAELIAGRNPLVPDTEGLEVRDDPDCSIVGSCDDSSLSLVSGFYESRLPSERPYVQDTDVSEPLPFDPGVERSIVNITIDENGTGTFSDRYESDLGKIENRVATRTNTGDSIVWAGTYRWSDYSSAGREDYEFTTETEVVDAGLRRQTGTFTWNFLRSYGFFWRVSYSLTGMVIAGSTRCEAIAGNYEMERRDGPEGILFATITATKDADDQHWRVIRTDPLEPSRDEYLTEALGSDFHCEFND